MKKLQLYLLMTLFLITEVNVLNAGNWGKKIIKDLKKMGKKKKDKKKKRQ